jgi:PTH2 family peptidyl-tRNA hydrolase
MVSKQVIVMRKDLNMRKGKMIAQGAHASMKVLLDLMSDTYPAPGLKQKSLFYDVYNDSSSWNDWLNGKFTKICLSVDSEEELVEIYEKAKAKGLKCSLIVDSGLTEFNGVPTKTCCAIGPEWSEKIDEITGHLKLL